jgi:signal recognition particle GTPase
VGSKDLKKSSAMRDKDRTEIKREIRAGLTRSGTDVSLIAKAITDLRAEARESLRNEMRDEVRNQLRRELKPEVKESSKNDARREITESKAGFWELLDIIYGADCNC